MKKNTFIFIVITALCFIGGCQTNNSNSNTSKSDIKYTYVLKEEVFEKQSDDMNIKIRYPQIKNSKTPAVKHINYIIKDNAIDQYYNKHNLKGLTLDQSYEVEMFNDEVLSISFYKYSNIAGTPHPNDSCHAVTINLKTAQKLSLSDFIESYKDLEDTILSDNYEILYGGLKSLNKNEIIELICDEFEKDNFYISKSGNICIIIDLPQSGGGYSIVKINQQSNLNLYG